MAKKNKPVAPKKPSAPLPQRWLPPVLLGWLIPGGGHFYLKRWSHGGLLMFSVLGMFVFGLMMRGRMFDPEGGSLFNAIVTYGGYIADLASGLPYFLAVWLGYEQPYLAQPQADYGTKFLVCAGLLNILAMVDAYEIAAGEKA